jgi:hypothetical protein
MDDADFKAGRLDTGFMTRFQPKQQPAAAS